MKCDWLILCEKVITDERSRNPTLIGLFTILRSNSESHSFNFVAAARLRDISSQPQTINLEVKMAGASVGRDTIEFTTFKGAANIFFEINNLVIKKYGTYEVELKNGSLILARASFEFSRP